MTDIATGSATELWVELVREAQARARLPLCQSQESYLVFTLTRLSRDFLLTARTVALEALEGWQETGAERADRLRDVGDRCLVIAGLLPGQARRRCVDDDYYISWGRLAYAELAACVRSALATLYAELAEAFCRLVAVLRALRDRDERAALDRLRTIGAGTQPAFALDAPDGASAGAARILLH